MKLSIRTIITIAICLGYFITNAQELKENKIDEFTKTLVKRTSYEIVVQNTTMNFFIRVSKLDSLKFLDVKMIAGMGKIVAIERDSKLMFMLENGEIITLNNSQTAVSCKGCGARGFSGSAAYGIATSYSITNENYTKLKLSIIKKIRVYTLDGFVESDVNDKRSVVIQKLLPLVE